MIETLLKNLPQDKILKLASDQLMTNGVQCFILYRNENNCLKTTSLKENILTVAKNQAETIKRQNELIEKLMNELKKKSE